jgi:hypothetical protein
MDGTLDPASAQHWLLHSAHGHALLDRVGMPVDEAADHLVEAAQMHGADRGTISRRPRSAAPGDTRLNLCKHEGNMNTNRLLKTLSRLSEHEFTVIVTKAAKKCGPI